MSVQAVAPRDHVVQFYDGVPELAASVGGYLAEGLRQGDVAVVVATPGHHAAFAAFLAGDGVDVAAARATGMLIELDAADTLSKLMADDAPDAGAFDATVGTLVRSALGRGRVRAYGEMVALLWDEGLVAAAMELEALWNDLGRAVDFSLFCAYPAGAVAAAERAAFAKVCHLHSAVLGAGPARCWPESDLGADSEIARDLPCTIASVREARALVLGALQADGRGDLVDLVDVAALVVTELATNAVLHARSDFRVTVRHRTDAVEISVWDASADLPVRRQPQADSTSGRGLRLVAAVASQWGVELPGHGKTVWAQLSASPVG